MKLQQFYFDDWSKCEYCLEAIEPSYKCYITDDAVIFCEDCVEKINGLQRNDE